MISTANTGFISRPCKITDGFGDVTRFTTEKYVCRESMFANGFKDHKTGDETKGSSSSSFQEWMQNRTND